MKINKLPLFLILTISFYSFSSPLFCSELEKDFGGKKLTSLPFKSSIDELLFSNPNSVTSDDCGRTPVVKSAPVKPSYFSNSLGEVTEDFRCSPTPIPNEQDVLLSLPLPAPYHCSLREVSYHSNHLLKSKGDKHNPFSLIQPTLAISFETLKLPSPVLKLRATLFHSKSLLLKSGQSSLSNSKA